ncbi:cbb3-type cytochrome c oxidase subunit 3 [Aureibacter tunicatorum]|uniref:Cbb3-type cytochrome oxidase component FixQ n=1 Tax=Aureibacter tunicatorum TaxID=866807 RepID=A0AAE4BR22_9BACT|nr:cbb3-type cytochrome c oxidase subunit 3 [Aureibacter tunicatorum]MDR6237325.1 hypothetical protein [Aureibacter tunicatorum]BDD06316.1 hypothetical protein AUTU_37990 [Aureibacter tunicatorum]
MFKHYFETIQDIEVGPLISLVIFVTFFVGLSIWIYFLSDKYVKHMKNMPIEESDGINEGQVA